MYIFSLLAVTGAMRKTESYSARDAQTEELQTKEHRERLRQDPTYRLEHDRTRADAIAEGSMRLNEIMRETEARHGREDDVNRMLRKRMREARRDEHRRDGHKRSLGIAEGIKLLPSGREEREVASLVMNAGEYSANTTACVVPRELSTVRNASAGG